MKQITEFLFAAARPRRLAVRIDTARMCKTHPGVRGSPRRCRVNAIGCGSLDRDRALQRQFPQECLDLDRAN